MNPRELVDHIRSGPARKELQLWMSQNPSSKAAEAVKAVASAIRLNHNLEHLYLRTESSFTDEAGVALAEALTVNKTLRWVVLDDKLFANDPGHTTKANLGAQACEAFCSCCASIPVSL
jgi:hypothetical protein